MSLHLLEIAPSFLFVSLIYAPVPPNPKTNYIPPQSSIRPREILVQYTRTTLNLSFPQQSATPSTLQHTLSESASLSPCVNRNLPQLLDPNLSSRLRLARVELELTISCR